MPQSRKRVQRDIFATPLDFQRRHPDFEEQKREEPEMQVELHRDLGYVPADGGPNVIGNAEDGPVLPDNLSGSGALAEVSPQIGGAVNMHLLQQQVLLQGAHQQVDMQDHG